MAITEAWTDPDTLEKAAGDVYRAADVNAVLGNQKYLYGGPRLTLVRNTTWDVDSQQDTTITWTSALVDEGGWWDSGSPSVAVCPETRLYFVSLNLLWPATDAGTYRRWRLLLDGEERGGERGGAAPFHEHGNGFALTITAGESLSVDVRHDAGSTLTLTPESPSNAPRWRSPILMVLPMLTPGSD